MDYIHVYVTILNNIYLNKSAYFCLLESYIDLYQSLFNFNDPDYNINFNSS